MVADVLDGKLDLAKKLGADVTVNTCLVHHTWRERYVWTPPSLRPVVQGDVEIKPLITNEFKLSEIKEAFDLADKDDTAIKIVLRP